MERHHAPDPSRLVAVIIPAHNAASTLDAALHSARGQSYDRLEIIVVDDGSTDQTAHIAAAHANEDPRVRLISQKQGGVAAARNRGIAATTAAFIAPLDADDLWHPEKIQRQMQALREAGDTCGLVYTFSVPVDESGEVTDWRAAERRAYQGSVLPDLLLHNFIANGSSPLLRKAAAVLAGGYDPGLRAQGAEGCEDLKLYLAIAEQNAFAAVPLPLTGYRASSTSMSSNVARMLRSHCVVTQPYRTRYPDHVDRGRAYLALYYARREFAAGNVANGRRALWAAARADSSATAKATVRWLLDPVASLGRSRRARMETASRGRTPFPAARAAAPHQACSPSADRPDG
ncbi:glycosyltransferase family 2 protein [uncultured Paracoccus sp.]|uniref:glycosyltransferase family 2 protein n=1 Tax=uncultured Paracoccus sp. TaxID=189685 RepID=UPI00261F9BC6|nr:glycosyltransferase family 2 protein [uncultured Paracoccus sp.]